MTTQIQIPGNIVNATASDVAEPIREFLEKVNLQSPTATPAAGVNGFDMIKSSATALTKWAAGGLTTLGALLGGTAGVTALLVGAEHEALRVSLVAATAAILTASALAVAWIVVTDVQERARTQRTRYEARTHVIDDYLTMVLELQGRQAPPTNGRRTLDLDTLQQLLDGSRR